MKQEIKHRYQVKLTDEEYAELLNQVSVTKEAKEAGFQLPMENELMRHKDREFMMHFLEQNPSYLKEIGNHHIDPPDYRRINGKVMSDTYSLCLHDPIFMNKVQESIDGSRMIKEEDTLELKRISNPKMKVLVTKNKTFEAALNYPKDSSICVLDFANNHSIGGGPYSAGAQEETLCRCSTLLPCLEHYKKEYYLYHQDRFRHDPSGDFGVLGNDDILYIPSVTVFKDDILVEPQRLRTEERMDVDIIVAAAPECKQGQDKNILPILKKRIRRILDVAEMNQEKILILGAFGCGAFHNDPNLVSQLFKEMLPEYSFDVVEFAIYCRGKNTVNYDIFRKILEE